MDILKAIETAIEDERQAQIKYRTAAENAEDQETRLMFLQLAKDEEQHERRLVERLKAIKLLGSF